jgi:hypothetical protein
MLGGGGSHHRGHGGLAGTGWAPEDGRCEPVGFNEGPQRGPGTDQMLLADDLVEGAGPKPGGERGPGLQSPFDSIREQVVTSHGVRSVFRRGRAQPDLGE